MRNVSTVEKLRTTLSSAIDGAELFRFQNPSFESGSTITAHKLVCHHCNRITQNLATINYTGCFVAISDTNCIGEGGVTANTSFARQGTIFFGCGIPRHGRLRGCADLWQVPVPSR